jgi:predicted O-methyltransferase YrrM
LGGVYPRRGRTGRARPRPRGGGGPRAPPRLSDGAYDLVFCDADPVAYPEYLTASIRLLRAGGIAIFNDALPRDAGPAEDGARELADMIRIDDRVVPLLLPIAGGLLAAIKK